MAEKISKTALQLLEEKHVRDTIERDGKITAAESDLRDAEEMVRDARTKLTSLQHESQNASFAYDAARARLEKPAESKAA